MYSGMTPKALEWQKKIRKFVNDELIPWEVHAEMNKGELPKEIEKKHKEMALSLGLSGMGISKENGGLGLDMFEQMIIWEQLGRVTNALSWCFPEVIHLYSFLHELPKELIHHLQIFLFFFANQKQLVSFHYT